MIRLANKQGLIKAAFGSKKDNKYGDAIESISLKDDATPVIGLIKQRIED